jgi:hypothetical protein
MLTYVCLFSPGDRVQVPPDEAFLDDEIVDTWEEECFGVHLLGGPYYMQDLYTLSNGGPGM